VPAARENGPVDLDEHLLVVLLELGRTRERAVRRRGTVGRAGAARNGSGRGQAQHGGDVRVAEPHEPPPRRQRAEAAPPHAPPLAAAAPVSLLLLLLRGNAAAAAKLRGEERRAAFMCHGCIEAVVAPTLPVGLDAALIVEVHDGVVLRRRRGLTGFGRGRSLGRSSGW
jgi:hypothetical protein